MNAWFELPWTMPLAGLVVGTLLGAVARGTHFCTLGALERHWYADDSRALRTWVLAIAAAAALTQGLVALGLADADASFYLDAPFNPIATVLGGFAFGLGMAMVGTCAFGALLQLGGGNLRALVVVTVVGLSALATQRGVLALVRERFVDPLGAALPGGSQSMGALAERLTGWPVHGAVAALVVAGLCAWVFAHRAYRGDRPAIAAAVSIGAAVAAGWWLTSMGHAAQLREVPIESATFVRPPSDLLFHLTIQTGGVPRYGVGLTVGVILGAVLVAGLRRDMRWEACDSARELGRHLAGATLMGIGGVLALGCTIGQGISAFSVLALSAPLAFASMLLGARVGLAWLLGDDGWFRRPVST